MTTVYQIGIVAFCVLVPLEIWVSARRQLGLYERDDTLANLALAVATGLTKLSTKGLALLAFGLVHSWAPFRVPADSLLAFAVLLLLNDAAFYVWHRLSHETRLLWALHVAHHNSRYLNITTSMRGNFVQHAFRWIFWTPLALLGFDPLLIVLADQIAYTYQLYIHTELVPKLGPLEWVLNTPSHHRVHHSSGGRHLNRNYGAVFIVWDRLFGTFAAETGPLAYGLAQPIQLRNLLDVLFHEFGALGRQFREHPMTLAQKVRYLFGRPTPQGGPVPAGKRPGLLGAALNP